MGEERFWFGALVLVAEEVSIGVQAEKLQGHALVKTVPSILHRRQMAALQLDVGLSEDHGLNTLERRTGR